jgi:hypothetical protein
VSDWVSIAANIASIISALVVPAAAFLWRRAQRWVTTNVTEKLDGLAADVRTLANQHTTLSDRFDNHVRDHDAHRRSWRF